MTIRAIISILVGFFVLGGGGYAGYQFLSQPKPQTLVVCKDDVKQCANGLSVNRISPACEFPLCPEERPKGSGGVTILPRTEIVGIFPGTLNDLRENGSDLTCTFSVEQGGIGTTGTVYVSQGDARIDLSAVTGSRAPALSHLIITEENVVMWNEGKTTGTRFASADQISGLPIDVVAPYTYDCATSTRNPATFVLPERVVFDGVETLVAP